MANFDYYNQGVCGPSSDRASVWYEVRGRGARVTVKVCTNNDIITDFGVILECNTQKCLGAPPQTLLPSECQLNETKDFEFLAENDVQYFVHVRSDIVDGAGSNFTIVYEDESLDGPITDPDPSELNGQNGGNSSGQLRLGVALAMLATASSAVFCIYL